MTFVLSMIDGSPGRALNGPSSHDADEEALRRELSVCAFLFIRDGDPNLLLLRDAEGIVVGIVGAL